MDPKPIDRSEQRDEMLPDIDWSRAPIGTVATTFDAPSGPLSASIYYWRDGVFENIGGPDSTGKIHIRPSDRLMAVLNAD